MTNRRTLLMLMVVFAALVAIVVWQAQPKPHPQSASDIITLAPHVFPELTVMDIQAIRIQDPYREDSFTISRTANGTWSAPGSEGILDLDIASDMAGAIALLTYDRTLPVTNETDLEQYGFRPRGVFFIAILETDGDQHGVAVGELTADRKQFYALVDERSEVYLIDRGPLDYLIQQYTSPPIT